MKIKVGLFELNDEKVYFPFIPKEVKDLEDSKFVEIDFNELNEVVNKWLQLKELLRYFQDLYSKAQLPSKDMDMTENRLFVEASELRMLSEKAKEILLKRNPKYEAKTDFVILTDIIDLLKKYIP